MPRNPLLVPAPQEIEQLRGQSTINLYNVDQNSLSEKRLSCLTNGAGSAIFIDPRARAACASRRPGDLGAR
jgi:hypothetical protein